VVMLSRYMLRWHLDTGSDVRSLDVEMAVEHWWWCQVAKCWDGIWTQVVILSR